MKFPNPLKVEVILKSKLQKKKKKKAPKKEPVDLNLVTLDKFKENMHGLLIENLKELYGKEKWKNHFMKRVNEVHNSRVTYVDLSAFEKGVSCNEEILLLFLMEHFFHKHKLKFRITEGGSMRI